MRAVGAVVLVVLGASCADESDAPPAKTEAPAPAEQATASLEGSWSRPLSEACTVALRIDTKTSTYAAHRICWLDEMTLGDELENGQADLSVAGQLTFRPQKASCPSVDHPVLPASYSLGDGRLSLRTPDGLLTFVHVMAGGTPYLGQIRYGCWTGADFTDHPLEDL
jgi:hypothetical protein